jgi:hypothetical protein
MDKNKNERNPYIKASKEIYNKTGEEFTSKQIRQR